MTGTADTPAGTVEISPSVLAALRQDAARAWPAECCALLIGTADAAAGLWTVARAVPTENAASRPDRFEVPAAALFAALRAAEAEGLAVIGHHHSHPNATAEPSTTDADCAYYPDHTWLITAVGPDGMVGETMAWCPRTPERGFRPLALKIIRHP